jgi:hypothetical protein
MNAMTSSMRRLSVVVLLAPLFAFAQNESIEPKVIVVPYPGQVLDGGVVAEPAPVIEAPPPAPVPEPPPPTPTPTPVEPPPEVPLVPSEGVMGPQPVQPPGAFLDGHPREGAFLSGPGSLTFVLHHTLMTGLGVLATQMVPRAVDAYCIGFSCESGVQPAKFTGDDARIAYLAGSLIGAGIGFGASAWWQFNHWIGQRSANFGIIASFIGGAFVGGLVDLIAGGAMPPNQVSRAYAVTWSIAIGSVVGAWLSIIVGGGDLAMNKATLIVSGAFWAMVYTALIVGIVAASGSAIDARAAVSGVLLTPAIGAAAMAFATLKFNPSTTQIMRANLFGLGVGAGVFLLSGLVLGLNWGRDSTGVVPYILGAVGAIGAKTVVSLLWVEAAENPPAAPAGPVSLAAPQYEERASRASVLW